ncbi:MAG: hypothetical protein OQL19_07415 [Gammaproteobacteria bacterium]|nr:hypothetical protein [Gammaproteobacteria bacterium]
MNIKNISFDNKYIRLLVMSFVIILALIFVQDFGDFLDENSNKVIQLGVNQHCNSATSICSASIINEGEFQRMSFAIKGDVASNLTFPVALTVIGFDFEGIESISVSFTMVDEDLENNLVLFTPDKSLNQVVPEKWDAVVKLPQVDNNRTDWFAVIRLKSSEKEYRAEFPFHF